MINQANTQEYDVLLQIDVYKRQACNCSITNLFLGKDNRIHSLKVVTYVTKPNISEAK